MSEPGGPGEGAAAPGRVALPDGGEIHLEVGGAGPALVLVHAGIADSRMWDEHVPPLVAAGFRVARYDLRGYGRSSTPARSFAGHEDLAALLDHLGVERAHLLGVSWGGRIALDFALAWPARVGGLVLVAPSVSGRAPSAELARDLDEEERLVAAGDVAAAAELDLRLWVDGRSRLPHEVDVRVRERAREMLVDALSRSFPAGVEERLLDPPAIRRLEEVAAPTLVVVGSLDLPEKLELAAELERRIPGARRVVLAGCAHMLPLERPGELVDRTLGFLGELA